MREDEGGVGLLVGAISFLCSVRGDGGVLGSEAGGRGLRSVGRGAEEEAEVRATARRSKGGDPKNSKYW